MHTPPPQVPLVAGTLCLGMIVIGWRRRGGLAEEGLTGSVRVLGGLRPASLVVGAP